MPCRSFPYVTVDVFTHAAFGGNPLAVVPDARGLIDRHMQSIASEFNYSETTFVFPPDDPVNTARVRIFTPTDEIPFAGHPNVGTAFVLASSGAVFGHPAGDTMVFEETAGLVHVAILREGGRVTGAQITVPRPLETAHRLDIETIAACASLQPGDIDHRAFEPVMISVGLPFAFSEVTGLEALGLASPNVAAFLRADERYPHPDDRFSLALFVRMSERTIRARVFAPLSNVPEDPATGSAAAALGACLAARRPEKNLRLDLTIEQGIELGRPSTMAVRVDKVNGVMRPVQVSGDCVRLMAGSLTLPE